MSIVDKVGDINIWKRGDQRAPHKPLLILYLLGQYRAGHSRLISFSDVESPLRQLLIDFGPHRKVHHPELPFWHLYNDGIWDLVNIEIPSERIGSASVKRSLLIDQNAEGGLKQEFYDQLKDPNIARQVVQVLLDENFPNSVHEDLLSAVGLDDEITTTRKKRDPQFREKILRAYQYQCAICGYSGRIGDVLVAVEAAHIKWHQAGGPDTNPNGVALCSLHHKLFDRGMITINNEYIVLVSELAHGPVTFDQMVMSFHGHRINLPERPTYQPEKTFIGWHVREVFHPPSRYLGDTN